MLHMTPIVTGMQVGTLMVIGLQAMMLPPAAVLPTLPTAKKEARKDEAESQDGRPSSRQCGADARPLPHRTLA